MKNKIKIGMIIIIALCCVLLVLNTNIYAATEQEIQTNSQKTLEKYFEFKGSGTLVGIVEKLNLITENEFMKLPIETDSFRTTTIKYEDFKTLILNYISEDLYNENYYNDYFKNKNGFLAILDGGGSGSTYTIKKMTLKSEATNQYTYIVSYDFSQVESNPNNYTGKAIIKVDNGKYILTNWDAETNDIINNNSNENKINNIVSNNNDINENVITNNKVENTIIVNNTNLNIEKNNLVSNVGMSNTVEIIILTVLATVGVITILVIIGVAIKAKSKK